MKILSYNVNGIRSAFSKGLDSFLDANDADIVCFQEIKSNIDDIPVAIREKAGYFSYWFPAQKKGYSGVGIMSKIQPRHVEFGCGLERYDFEGRCIRVDFEDFSVMSLYVPSGSSGEDRQLVKDQFMVEFGEYLKKLLIDFPKLVVCGDFNVCHTEIDIHNPVSNKNSSGFLKHEREWIGDLLESGFVDSFRFLYPGIRRYSWWSFRFNARSKNLGWRIDYHMVSEGLKDSCRDHVIHTDVIHSDHCPIELILELGHEEK